MSQTYPLSPQGVFATIQGEGAMLGLPMIFVRLAGCSIGCPECDTDYRVSERTTAAEIARRAVAASSPAHEWVWLTGGEPTDHDIYPLVGALRRAGFRVALATAGVRPVVLGSLRGGVDFLSVSPHNAATWVQKSGCQLNLVPGLNGLKLADMVPSLDTFELRFTHRFVTPCADSPQSLAECMEWVSQRPGWRIGIQAHKVWKVA